jgi:ComF family protein
MTKRSVLDIIYPPRCVFCREFLKDGEREVCPECVRELPWTYGRCRVPVTNCDTCVAPLEYRDAAAQALLRFKFSGRTTYARCFARLMAECLRGHTDMDFDLVTWVPLAPVRYAKRGYSQSKLLASALARELGLPKARLLAKKLDTQKQSGVTGAAARRANVSGAFSPVGSGAHGKKILLVDDVVTTGATLSECSLVLRLAGAAKVTAAALCTAHKSNRRTGRE